MKSIRFSRSARVTAFICGSAATAWFAAGCGSTDDVPGGATAGASDEAGASGRAGANNGGRAGANNGGRAGASGGHAGAGGAAAGSENPGGGSGGSGVGGAAGGGAPGGGSAGMSGSVNGGAGAGGASAGSAGALGGATSGGAAGAGQAGMSGSAGKAGSGGGGGASAGSGGGGGASAGSGGGGGASAGSSGSAGNAGALGTGGNAGSGGASAVCGNGIKEAAEQCDDAIGTSTVSTSPKCSNSCTSVSTQACVDCENAGDCFESVDNCLGVATLFTSAQQTQCFSVMTCIEKSNCFDGTGTLGKCYCGTLSTAACGAAPFTGAGSPDGACVAEIKAGFPTFTTNTAILGGLTASDFPSGAAMKRLSCQKGANSSACLTTCGFTAGGPVFP